LIIDNLEALLADFSRFVLTHDSNVQTESSSKVWENFEDGILNIAHCDNLNLITLCVVQQHIKICCWTLQSWLTCSLTDSEELTEGNLLAAHKFS